MLHKLVQLRLHTNLLKSLPTSLTELTNLELLTLRDNEIGEKKAPEFLSSLHKLKTLTLGKNKMKKLPDLELQGDSAYDTKWMVRIAVSLESHLSFVANRCMLHASVDIGLLFLTTHLPLLPTLSPSIAERPVSPDHPAGGNPTDRPVKVS